MKRLIYPSLLAVLCLLGLSFSPIGRHQTNHPVSLEAPVVETDSLDLAVEALMKKHAVPGVSMSFMKDLKIAENRTYGILQKGNATPVDDKTVFSVGSISKVVTAILTLKYVHAGKLDLDTDVNQYLSEWKVGESKFNQEQPVTLRLIMSHTAGFSVHGFGDYNPEEKLPTTLQILNGSGPAKNRKVKLILPVGKQFKYSGGGTTVIQKIMEDLNNKPFHEVVSEELFGPLQLQRSSFENPLPSSHGNIAKAHNGSGSAVALPRGYQSMPEAAASGLWTTPSDLLNLLSKVMKAQEEEKSEFISAELVDDMITREEHTIHGLGPRIYHRDGLHIVSHGGSNDSYRAKFTLFWNKKAGYAIFTNGSNGTRLINELEPLAEKFLNL